jgi:hypothetical protein
MRSLVLRLRQGCDIGAVMLSLRLFSSKLNTGQGFLFFFVGGKKYF